MVPGPRESTRRWWPPAVVAVLALVAAALLWTAGDRMAPEASDAGSPTTATVPAGEPPTTSTRRGRVPAGAPRRVVVASLGIDARVVPVATEGTSLEPPADPGLLGWWSGGAPVGAARGTALVTGHTVNAGGGAMDDLEQVAPGAEIEVTTSDGPIRYVATSVRVLDKDTLARRAPDLFSQEVPGRLVLVTCEDWDGTGYRSNVVVTAVPIG